MSSLMEHAEFELRRAGWLDGDSEPEGRAILAAVKAFAEGGWSGGSAPYGVAILADLLRFRPLGPLTSDPAEWIDVTDLGHGDGRSGGLWQSRRRPDAFSTDGGRTYRLQSDARVRYDRRDRWRWLLWRLGRGPQPVGYVRGGDFARTRLHRSAPPSAP